MPSKALNFREIKPILIVVILLLPLLFIYIRDSYDWEGDTALLLQQAENITSGRSFYLSNYIYNPSFPILSPQYYPPITPLLFSSIYVFFGHNIAAYLILESAIYFLSGIFVFILLKRFFNNTISIISSVLLFYNQFVLNTKLELMSDIPFLFFVMLFFLLVNNEFLKLKKPRLIIAALVAVLAVQTRSIGYAIPLSLAVLVCWEIIKLAKSENPKALLYRSYIINFLIFISSFIIFSIVFKILFPSPTNGISIYYGHFLSTSFHTLARNPQLYTSTFLDIIASPLANWGILTMLIRASFLIITIIGAYKISRNSIFRFPLIFLLIYLIVLLVYPYNSAAIRFILPILPFLLVLFLSGFMHLINLIKWKPVKFTIIGILLFSEILIAAKGQYNFYERNKKISSDLTSEDSLQAFQKVKQIVAQDKIIECSFPRIISFYSNRKSYSSINQANDSIYISDWKKFNASYVLISLKFSFVSEIQTVEKLKNKELSLVWSNNIYCLYKIKK